MMKQFVGFAAAALVTGAAFAQHGATIAGDMPRSVQGRWKVVGVAVSDQGVQALSTNDPSYMGRTLTFSSRRLGWDKPVQAATEGPCAKPVVVATPRDPDPSARATVRKIGGPAVRAFSVRCASGSWGPNDAPAPTFLLLRDGTLGLWWFDNALLKLRRTGSGTRG